MSINEVQQHIADGDGHMQEAIQSLNDIHAGYQEGSDAAQALGEALVEVYGAIARIENANDKIDLGFSLARFAVQNAIEAYGPEKANLDFSDRPAGHATIDIARTLLKKIETAYTESRTHVSEFNEEKKEPRRVAALLSQSADTWYHVLGITAETVIPKLQATAKEQQNASETLKPQIG